jgi:K+-sensing histidine kinase KdpD
MRKGSLSFWAGFGLAAGSTALAALARWLVPWALTPAPYLGFYPAVVVSAALGGVGPGLVATFASLFLVNFVFGHFNVHDTGAMTRQVIWVVASIGVSFLAGKLRDARVRERLQAEELRRWNDELEERAAAQTMEIRKTNETLELQVVERTSALRESEERFRVAQELSPDGFTIYAARARCSGAH